MRFVPLLVALWVLPAAAATPIEQVRADLAAAKARLSTLETRQQRAQGELDELASEIKFLKSRQREHTIGEDRLEVALRRSQELSIQLHALSADRAIAEAELADHSAALWKVLDEEVKRARDEAIAAREPAGRQRALERFRTLRAEREALRTKLPASFVPRVTVDVASEDPEELLEQADALRDAEDKVKRRLSAVRARITEVRRERELDRRMGDFLGDEALFDEGDRRLRVQGSTVGGFRAAPTEATPPAPMVAEMGDAPAPLPMQPTAGPDQGFGPQRQPEPPPIATDGRPQIGAARAPGSFGSDELTALEREAQRLEQQAASLSSRAKSVEERARTLD